MQKQCKTIIANANAKSNKTKTKTNTRKASKQNKVKQIN